MFVSVSMCLCVCLCLQEECVCVCKRSVCVCVWKPPSVGGCSRWFHNRGGLAVLCRLEHYSLEVMLELCSLNKSDRLQHWR